MAIQIYFHPGQLCSFEGIRAGVHSKFLNPVSSVQEVKTTQTAVHKNQTNNDFLSIRLWDSFSVKLFLPFQIKTLYQRLTDLKAEEKIPPIKDSACVSCSAFSIINICKHKRLSLSLSLSLPPSL